MNTCDACLTEAVTTPFYGENDVQNWCIECAASTFVEVAA